MAGDPSARRTYPITYVSIAAVDRLALLVDPAPTAPEHTSFRDLQPKHKVSKQKDKRPQYRRLLRADLVQDRPYRQRSALHPIIRQQYSRRK
jgi:hypothetical protein